MSTLTTSETRNITKHADSEMPEFEKKLTVLTIVKTMLEIINVKKSNTMDKNTQAQFPLIAKEIILLAEQVQQS